MDLKDARVMRRMINDTCIKDSNDNLVALMCEDGVWVAVQDGPCMPVLHK